MNTLPMSAVFEPRQEESAPTSHWLRIIFKDGSPPLEGLDAAEFVVRRVRSGNSERSEILHSTEIMEGE
jgi:hypothetical protein